MCVCLCLHVGVSVSVSLCLFTHDLSLSLSVLLSVSAEFVNCFLLLLKTRTLEIQGFIITTNIYLCICMFVMI